MPFRITITRFRKDRGNLTKKNQSEERRQSQQ
jgi:hypothetical protein